MSEAAGMEFPEVVVYVETREESGGSVRLCRGIDIGGIKYAIPAEAPISLAAAGAGEPLTATFTVFVNDVRFEEVASKEWRDRSNT